MRNTLSKILAMLLSLCMIIGFLPVTSQAALLDGDDYIFQQLSLGDDLVLHLWGNVPEQYVDSGKATLSYCGNTYDYTLSDLTPHENGMYDLPIEMAVAQMTENINLVLKVGILEGINENYSIRAYLETLINGDYNRETKALAKELLNLGGWAQKYFDYNTGDLANKNYGESKNAVPEEIPTIAFAGAVPGVQFFGTSVRFLSKTAVRFYFVLENGQDGLTFTVDGNTYTPVDLDGLSYIEVPGINPQDMGTKMHVQVTDGNDTVSVYYAPIDYFIRSYHKAEDDTSKSLMSAAYSYFTEAASFAGVSNLTELTFTGVSGNANAIELQTNLPEGLTLSSTELQESVSMNGTAMTVSFANAYSAGEYYTMPKGTDFVFTDNSQYVLKQDYIFQFDGSTWSIAEASGDFQAGVGFEEVGNILRFAGEGTSDKAATVARVAHGAEVSALYGGGDYALKLSHATSYFPTFSVSFGQTLPAGTVIKFMAYGKINGESAYNQSIFEYKAGGEATAQFKCDKWTELSITLESAADHLDLFWNFDRAQISGTATGAVYVDNFIAIVPTEPAGDILEGYGFDVAGNAAYFEGIGEAQDATIYRTTYADAGVAAPANGGEYALKLSHASHYYPTFELNFGKTLEAGTTVTFDVYGTFDGWVSGNDMNIEFTGDSGSGQVVYMIPDTWFTASITLAADCDHLQFFWNIERGNGISGDVASFLLIDNVKATELPVEPSGDILAGYGFEEKGNAERFTGIGASQDATIERVTYAAAGVTAENGSEYALKLSHNSHYYPTFQLNFGKTLKKGTTVTFRVYGSFDGWVSGNDMNIELTGDSGSGQIAYMIPEAWFTATITLAADCDHLQFFWNIERGNGISGDVASYILIDDVKAVEPPVEPSGDILAGYGFEEEGNALRFTGIGASQDATIERVTYAAAGVPAENGSEYALKLSHNSHYYPTFQLNFGQTLEAGSVITFRVYGSFDGWVSGNDMNIELTGDSGSGQIAYMIPEAWFTATVTLTEARDHLQFFWNIERGNGISGDVASYILIDDVKATAPDNTFYNGLTFDNSSDVNYFGTVSGQEWRSPALEIVSFGGDNALKVTCGASQWPALRINFGRTLPTGTQIAFQAYTNDTTGIRTTVSIFEAMANCTETAQYYHGEWTNLVTTLTADCSYIDLCVNFDRWNEITASNIEVYIDNVIVQQDFTAGADFEMPYDVRFFTGAGNDNAWRDATAQIVSKDGSNVLMMTGANSLWPTFKIDFGTTLKAGTTISFDVLGVIDYEQEGMSMTFNPLESNVQTDEYGQAVWMLCDEWTNKTITLTADCSSISFYWDAGRNNLPDGIVSYVYIDNVVVNPA